MPSEESIRTISRPLAQVVTSLADSTRPAALATPAAAPAEAAPARTRTPAQNALQALLTPVAGPAAAERRLDEATAPSPPRPPGPLRERRADPDMRRVEDELNELLDGEDVSEQFAAWSRGLDQT